MATRGILSSIPGLGGDLSPNSVLHCWVSSLCVWLNFKAKFLDLQLSHRDRLSGFEEDSSSHRVQRKSIFLGLKAPQTKFGKNLFLVYAIRAILNFIYARERFLYLRQRAIFIFCRQRTQFYLKRNKLKELKPQSLIFSLQKEQKNKIYCAKEQIILN